MNGGSDLAVSAEDWWLDWHRLAVLSEQRRVAAAHLGYRCTRCDVTGIASERTCWSCNRGDALTRR